MRAPMEHPVSRRLLQAVVRIIRSESRYPSVVRRVLAAERLYAKQAADASERQEMRAATANLLFYAAIDKGAAFHTVERRFREVLSLSCGDLASVASDVAVSMNFAVFCGSRGRPAAGVRRLEHLEAELNRVEGSVPKGFLAHCRREVALVLRRLREG
jgi:hypothetical protein